MARWFEDYAGDLMSGGFDTTDIRIACANWRTAEHKHMPSPGELLAYCRKVFNPDRYALPPSKVQPLPGRVFSDEHKARMQADLKALMADLTAGKAKRGQIERRGGETEVQHAERLWPNHRADRIQS